MRTGSVSSDLLRSADYRLNGGFFLSEDQQALLRLERVCGADAEQVADVALRVFKGGLFRKIEASGPDHGRPYVSAKDLERVLVENSGYISHLHGRLLDSLSLDEGVVLVTCSGMNLGKAILVRRDMAGLCASGDLIRVVPDAERIGAGYLYAYLSTKFARVAIRRQIYGGNIKHVDPAHVAQVPVPRFGSDFEATIDGRILEAAALRAAAVDLLSDADRQFSELCDLTRLEDARTWAFGTSTVSSSEIGLRFDATYHSRAAVEAQSALKQSTVTVKPLREVVRRYFKPPMFKRLWVDSGEYGPAFVSGNDAYRVRPTEQRYVSWRTPNVTDFIVEKGWLLFQGAGQVYGLFGTPLLVHGWLDGAFVADDMYRLVPKSLEDGGFLYALLASNIGQALLRRQASGNSIPRVWDPHIEDMVVPWPDEEVRRQVGSVVWSAFDKITSARALEDQAFQELENAIQGGD